ncbi:indole-3-glycerol-phosphate synthase [Paenibacillus baekrokdamisoli]|uniref:Indole-3-glycerol phosphate synthase n=1 Tax=Paenibacillus baekrokdamisoli TaxID=1712516 RepID=A0A3G9J804_9BACL|nr:indole-3-glycerol phosphate synthase TrpC [Paenibacillus baekrokdamisoli]MBB3069663.1 indole-3-glycerol phosphate synthase [Paenibacillus baekrokdamisoli]BBH20983.1 indole-3-glycerol-phosphate synthase [Paenibacillus baekrokdamisoli]
MFLDKIVASKRKEVDDLAESFSLNEYERQIAELPPCKGFEHVIAGSTNRPLGLIAEVKKASPSKGLIRADFDPVALARTYEAAGADCISVLTDEDYFQGKNEYLTAVRSAVSIPLLRKDFTVDYRQIYEARVIGADAILLIAAILRPSQLSEFYDIAKSIGLDVLVEVHDQEEMEAVLGIGKAKLIGINNRNLQTFETDITTTEKLIGLVPAGVSVISESSISVPQDISYVQSVGAKGVLVGEFFMRQPDVAAAVEELMGPVTRK